MNLTFQKIVRENIFSDDFSHMAKDNEIEFPEIAGHTHLVYEASPGTFQYQMLKDYVVDLVNRKSKGGGIDRTDFLTFIQSLSPVQLPKYDEDKLRFILEDIHDKKSIVDLIRSLVVQDTAINEAVTRVEEPGECAEG